MHASTLSLDRKFEGILNSFLQPIIQAICLGIINCVTKIYGSFIISQYGTCLRDTPPSELLCPDFTYFSFWSRK
jgi:hypothetical protein